MHIGRSRAAHALGPIFFQVETGRPMVARVAGGAILAGCVSLFAVASRLEPMTSGIGTHEQLGLPPCGMAVLWGVPCPTCGMTTAFAYAARGRWASSFHAQPAGLAVAVGIAGIAAIAMRTLATGRTHRVNWYRLAPARVGIGVVSVLLAGWAYKIIVTMYGW